MNTFRFTLLHQFPPTTCVVVTPNDDIMDQNLEVKEDNRPEFKLKGG